MTSSRAFILIAALSGAMVVGKTVADDQPVFSSISVFPKQISLTTARDSQRVIVIAVTPDNVHRDITSESMFEVADPLVSVTAGVVRPISEGDTTIRVRYGGLEAPISISVREAIIERPISFSMDVMPVFMASGCNSGACHGSARGQDGFRLSLFGFDPEGDYDRLTRQAIGRRINLAQPIDSLLIEKAVGAVRHTGGKRFDVTDPEHESILRWIEAGAPADFGAVAQVVGVELFPPHAVVRGSDQQLQMIVLARYSDGTDRDVTGLAVFRTNNETSLDVVSDGLVRSGAAGEAFVTASFDTHTVGSQFIVLPEGAGPAVDPATLPTANFIDEHINAKLADLRVTPSDRCTDEVFIRRVYLDIVGLLPSPEETAAFISDASPDKRGQLIDRLLNRPEFIDQWVMQWAELLQVRSNNQISYKSTLLYYEWLRDNLTGGVTLDELTRRILTATGGTFAEPATNFYQNPEVLVLAENVAQSFMGIRIQCAQCHNHPFDRWTQDDYYGFVSFFTQVGRKQGEDRREVIIFNRGGGEYNHPVTGRPVPPTFLGGDVADTRGRDRRAVLAEWLTSPSNPYFARSIVNRVWAHFMGVGVVEPVDDLRISNPPTNEPLLDALAEQLIDANYDLKAIVRAICNSEAYQRSTDTNATNARDERNFSHALVRRLRAETLLDIICQVTEQPEKLRGLPLGARAVEIADGSTTNYFLTTFGRARRDSVCSCEVVREPSLSQALHLLNGDTVHRKVTGGPVIERYLDSGQSPAEIIDQLYHLCLTRHPTDAEREAILATIGDEADPRQALEDVFWSILNSNEFLFNH